MAEHSEKMNNPLLFINNNIRLNDEVIEFNKPNLYKNFNKVYVLCKMNNDIKYEDILLPDIDINKFNSIIRFFILYEVNNQIISVETHFNKMIISQSEYFQNANHFNYELPDTILILPIYEISFLNIQKYLDNCFDNQNTLKDLYNQIVISENYNIKNTTNLRYFSNYKAICNIINNLEAANYWSYDKNTFSLLYQFKSRNFNYIEKKDNEIVSSVIIKDDKLNNYIDDFFEKKTKDNKISSISNYNYFFEKEKCDFSIIDIQSILNHLDHKQKNDLIFKLLYSKKYCHLIFKYSGFYEYYLPKQNTIDNIISYGWLRMYMDELKKQGYLKTDDEIVFNLDNVHNVNKIEATCHFGNNLFNVLPLPVDIIVKNVYGVRPNKNTGILTNIQDIRSRMNTFITGDNKIDIFKDINFKENKMAICGSIIAACVQNNNPLENLFETFYRYTQEYYTNSDIDIMIKTDNYIEFIDICKNIFKNIVLNIEYYFGINNCNMKFNNKIFVYINNTFIKNNFNDYDYIIKNIESKEVLEKLIPYIKKEHNKLYGKYYDKYDNLFNFNKENINIILYKNEYKDDIDIKYNLKCMIKSKLIHHNIELFMVNTDDFMTHVSKFHLPCVRAYYDYDNIYMTPSFITAHKTLINMDYKYFSGQSIPMDIINKYRMRGFGTILNLNEIKTLIKYSVENPFWNKLYEIGDKTSYRNIIRKFLYYINIYSPFFKPRLICKENYIDPIDNSYKSICDLNIGFNYNKLRIFNNHNGVVKCINKINTYNIK
jgi:hypothetical protein